MDAAFEWILANWDQITVALLLVILLYGGSRKDPWWVFGWMFKERTLERNEWKKAALKGTLLAKRSVEVAEEVVEDD